MDVLRTHNIDGVDFRPGDAILEHSLLRFIQIYSTVIIPVTLTGWTFRFWSKYPNRPLDIYRLAEVCGMASCASVGLGCVSGTGVVYHLSQGWDEVAVRQRYIYLRQNRYEDIRTRTAARCACCGTITTLWFFNGGLLYRLVSGIGIGSIVGFLISTSDLDRTFSYGQSVKQHVESSKQSLSKTKWG